MVYPKSTFLFIFAKLILTLKFMRFFYAFVAFLVSCASVFAQANLTGTITDASGQPLPGVTVSVLENGQIKSGDITDGDGNYRISGSPAKFRV